MPEPFDPYYQWLGIPPGPRPPDAYRLLGLARFESNPAVIRSGAQRQMAHLRTYALGEHSALSQRLLNEVAAAQSRLLDPRKKAAYDQALAAHEAGWTPYHGASAADASAEPVHLTRVSASRWRLGKRGLWAAAGVGVAGAVVLLLVSLSAFWGAMLEESIGGSTPPKTPPPVPRVEPQRPPVEPQPPPEPKVIETRTPRRP